MTKEEILKDIKDLCEEFDIKLYPNDVMIPQYLDFEKAEYINNLYLALPTTLN